MVVLQYSEVKICVFLKTMLFKSFRFIIKMN